MLRRDSNNKYLHIEVIINSNGIHQAYVEFRRSFLGLVVVRRAFVVGDLEGSPDYDTLLWRYSCLEIGICIRFPQKIFPTVLLLICVFDFPQALLHNILNLLQPLVQPNRPR